MDLKERVNVVQAKMNGAVAALTYGYFAHMNDAGGTTIDIDEDIKAVDVNNIDNSACSSEMLRGLVHAFTNQYKGKLTLDETVCDPKYIPMNCIMKDKSGYMQRGAYTDLMINCPYIEKGKHDWTEGTISDTERRWYSVCYGNDKFVAVSINYFAYSTDGINWTEGTISSTSRYWESVCYGNDKFVAVAYNSNYFAYSTDGMNWTEGTISSTSRQWYSVCYGNGKFITVAYRSNYFAYSTDGMNWAEGTISSTSRYWESVCYGNGKFVAVADSSNYFAYSTDGINWTETTISSTSRDWFSVCYGNGKFVAVAYGSTYFAYSTDGITWIEGTISSTSRYWESVCYGNGKFVAVASRTNYFAYSTDGITWTENTISSTSRNWVSVCYGNGKYIVVADSSNYFAYSFPSYNFNTIDNLNTSFEYNGISNSSNIYINESNIDEGFLIETNNITKGIIPFGDITAPDEFKNAIQTNEIYSITSFYKNNGDYGRFYNDLYYRYFKFFDNINGNEFCLAITNDMMHFTCYKCTGEYAFRDGVLFMYIPEKDAIAMITRHPHTTDIITIDGNDPENMTDYTKPYYKLIELPFLKKYYKYSGKHVQNIVIAVTPSYECDLPVFNVLTDHSLMIGVFDRFYQIGIPNFTNNQTTGNNHRIEEYFTAGEETTENYTKASAVSYLNCNTYSSDSYMYCRVSPSGNTSTVYNCNITIDYLANGYDSVVDETENTNGKNNVSNYTYSGMKYLGDKSVDSVLYPITEFAPGQAG